MFEIASSAETGSLENLSDPQPNTQLTMTETLTEVAATGDYSGVWLNKLLVDASRLVSISLKSSVRQLDKCKVFQMLITPLCLLANCYLCLFHVYGKLPHFLRGLLPNSQLNKLYSTVGAPKIIYSVL